MHYGWRAPALRLTALSALVVSAALTADRLHPGRGFCPLAAACDKASKSALGTIQGVPTSVIGMAAFGGLFFLTLLPIEWGRKLLRPGGILAAVVGAGLFAYQATVLGSFCPLCLVADAAGLVAGLVTITWPKPPIRRSGKRLPGEALEKRLRWTATALVAVSLPFVWPREAQPGWVEIRDAAILADLDAADEPDAAAAPAPPPATPAGAPAATPDAARPPPAPLPDDPRKPPAPTAMPWSGPGAGSIPANLAPSPRADPVPASPPRSPAPAPRPPPPPAPPPVPKADVAVVEYLNAFCPHCRVTHARFDAVTARSGLTVRFRRVYSWSSAEPPLWALVCAGARGQGLEDRVFAQMLLARRDTPAEVWEAARRAGADLEAIRLAMDTPETYERLARHRQAGSNARLAGLPTLDIGRRRLMGEQSEQELQEALDAARALSRGRR